MRAMDAETAEFQDWEMLHPNSNSDSESLITAASAGNTNGVDDEIGSETGGIVQVNYFSIDSQSRYMSGFTCADGSDEVSEESDNPSWIDPGSENRFTMKNSGEFWSDSGSEQSETRKFGEYEGRDELCFQGNEEIKSENGKNPENGEAEGEKKNEITEVAEQRKTGEQTRSVVWWKVPIELLKFCAFRVSPVWTLSVAAAVLGLVILGRRLYKLKKKTKALELKVTVDDKKVSQFMTRVARLNEAFSIVKRVPLIRPQLPAAGVTPWPVLSLR